MYEVGSLRTTGWHVITNAVETIFASDSYFDAHEKYLEAVGSERYARVQLYDRRWNRFSLEAEWNAQR